MSVASYPGLSIILVNDDENILLIKSGLNSIISLAGGENVSEQQGENPSSVWQSFLSLFTYYYFSSLSNEQKIKQIRWNKMWFW